MAGKLDKKHGSQNKFDRKVPNSKCHEWADEQNLAKGVKKV